ncbi:unnamed protein product [Mytilus edulis]|uniref:CCHC-type domain-containing protein n=1 Tax=Mytilus edulis TaxID=6550 RepID=A0A8S3VFR3_MYTED|nr:unnamed protein product [Mytilus edulis]
MDLTSTFFKNITSFLGDFSGFKSVSEDFDFLQSSELYNIDDCTDRTLSYVINFRNNLIYNLFKNILFGNYSEEQFVDRDQNGLVHSFDDSEGKVVLHMYESTNTLHIQGKGCIFWFKNTFKIFAEELYHFYNTQKLDDSKIVKFKNVHNEDNENISIINQIGSTQNSNVSETNPKVVQYMTSDCVETESKLAHSMTSINTDTVITSTPSRKSPDTNELLLDFNTLSPININHHESINLQEEIFELKKTVCHLMNLINNKPIVTDKGTQVTTCDASTQTDDFQILATTKPETNSIGTQIHPDLKDSTMQTSPPEENKGKRLGNGSQQQKISRNFNNNNILVIGSSLLKSINIKDLINTRVSTNRGARIIDIINIVKDADIRQYQSIIVHIGGNDISNGATLNLIHDNYESLLYLLRSKADMNTNIIVSSVPPRKDTNVEPFNRILIDLCDYYNLQYIDHSKCFYDDYGYVKKTLYQRDGIHLTKMGTMVFLQNIDQYVKILKLSSNNDYCQYCGERGHDLTTCRHGKPVSCFSCNSFGHKKKFCDLYWS